MYLKVNVDVEWGLVCCDLIRKDLCQDKVQILIEVDPIQLLCQHYKVDGTHLFIDTNAR